MSNLTSRDFRLHLDKLSNRYTVSLPFTRTVDYVVEPEDWDMTLLGETILDVVGELAGDEAGKSDLYRERCLQELTRSVVRPVDMEELPAVAAHWYNEGYKAGVKAGEVL